MAMTKGPDISQMLVAISDGDEGAREEFFLVVYSELRGLAAALMAGERPNHTLQPTGLVHEAYLRLVGSETPPWHDRAHFFRTAARAMRRILVDHARGKASLKRGGDWLPVSSAELVSPDFHPEEVIWVSDVLEKLGQEDQRMADIVEFRYFGGLGVEETARALQISERSVYRSWRAAKAWLRRELDREAGAPSPAPGHGDG
jgi:RNA polymerase sigma-70 factor (ECF subfamily)